jgi:hypothetical protein
MAKFKLLNTEMINGNLNSRSRKPDKYNSQSGYSTTGILKTQKKIQNVYNSTYHMFQKNRNYDKIRWKFRSLFETGSNRVAA